MGKIIQDGFDFVARANAHLLKNLDDIPELKHRLITLSEIKSQRDLSVYALALGAHVSELSGLAPNGQIDACCAVMRQWQAGAVNFRAALDVAGALNDLAREEKDRIKAKALRAWGQIAATPHVRWHPLVASEYVIAVVNLLYPKQLEPVEQERRFQIELMTRSVYQPENESQSNRF